MSLPKTRDTRAFNDFLLERAKSPFVWGARDCCLFAADAIFKMTGTDIADDFRGQYHDEKSAFVLIKKVTGGETVADAAAYCAEKFGLPEWDQPMKAQRGDLAVIENAGRLIAGVVHLNGRHVVSISESGLVRLPISKIKRAWRVSEAFPGLDSPTK